MEGRQEWFAGLPFCRERELTGAEADGLKAIVRQYAYASGFGFLCLAVSPFVGPFWGLTLTLGMVAAPVIFLGFGPISALRARRVRVFGSSAHYFSDDPNYQAIRKTTKESGVTRCVGVAPNGRLVLLNGRPFGNWRLTGFGRPRVVTAYVETTGTRLITLSEREEIRARMRHYWGYLLLFIPGCLVAVFEGLHLLGYLKISEYFEYWREAYSLIAAYIVAREIIAAFRIIKLMRLLRGDLDRGEIALDAQGNQRLADSGLMWTERGVQSFWRVSSAGLSSARASHAETTTPDVHQRVYP